ncbi:MAG: UDP-N-acetylmuramoyl-L-alanyl-D-glutamate--2,6-diaminopimelate ligase [Chromatiales bacterium]
MMTATPISPLPTLRGLLAGLVTLDARHDRRVQGLALDSRRVRAGDVFLATPGTRVHGRDYIDVAVERGAVAVLVESDAAPAQVHAGGVPIIAVPALKAHVGEIAARFYGEPSRSLRVVGVTGTNGKTTVSHLLAHALTHLDTRRPCGIIGTIGIGFPGALQPAEATTPDPIALQAALAEMRDRGAGAVATEVSSHALDQHRVAGVRFAAAVFTNLTRDHLDYHRNMDAYGEAKARLFLTHNLKAAVINLDDRFGRQLLASIPPDVAVYRYTEQAAGADADVICGTELRSGGAGLDLVVRRGERQGRIHTRLLGRFNAANLLAAFSAVVALGVPWDQAVQAFQSAGGVPGRMEPFGGTHGDPLVVVDYAHTPDGLQQVLRSARELCRGRLWCVFGCGGNRDPGKRPLMGAVAAELADEVIVTSDNPREEEPERIIAEILSNLGAGLRVRSIPERSAAVTAAVRQAGASDVVVVAGKGHEDYQEVRGQRLPLSDRVLVLAALGEARGGRRG